MGDLGEKRAKMLRWLYSKPFDTKHIEICSRIQKNTGGWILATPEFCGWSKDPNPLVLWGHGIRMYPNIPRGGVHDVNMSPSL